MQIGSSQHPYIPNTPADREEMLKVIGVSSVEDLFKDIPQGYSAPSLDIPQALPEMELLRELEALGDENRHADQGPFFLGAGAYRHYIPAVVQAIVNRGEFLTAYTPYQPEVSQGTLQAAYEFQTVVGQILDMDVANAGMYDGASSLAEGALMACRIKRRYKVAYLDTISPDYVEVLKTYALPQGIEIYPVTTDSMDLKSDTACIVIQSPNFYGYIEPLENLIDIAHNLDVLSVIATDPFASVLFKPPGSYGADIVTAEGQPLGVPVSFGGPYVGLFTCKKEYVRQLPGRVVGKTVDSNGRTAYVLTLQTREQHIRRERATSNICTSTALIGLMATVYSAILGKEGIKEVAQLCYQKSHYAASLIEQLPGYSLPLDGVFFQEFVVECPRSPADINEVLASKGIIGGLDISDRIHNGMLICVTEVNTKSEIETLVQALADMEG